MAKKFIVFALCAILLLSAVGCRDKSDGKIAGFDPAKYFVATVIEQRDGSLLVEPHDNYPESQSADRIVVPISHLTLETEIKVGDRVEIWFDGVIQESYPATVTKVVYVKVVPPETYGLSVANHTDLLYEQPKERYAAGEHVVIKMHILTDVRVECFVNGKSVGTQTAIKTGDSYTHWEFYFEMPAEDVTVEFAISDGVSG